MSQPNSTVSARSSLLVRNDSVSGGVGPVLAAACSPLSDLSVSSLSPTIVSASTCTKYWIMSEGSTSTVVGACMPWQPLSDVMALSSELETVSAGSSRRSLNGQTRSWAAPGRTGVAPIGELVLLSLSAPSSTRNLGVFCAPSVNSRMVLLKSALALLPPTMSASSRSMPLPIEVPPDGLRLLICATTSSSAPTVMSWMPLPTALALLSKNTTPSLSVGSW